MNKIILCLLILLCGCEDNEIRETDSTMYKIKCVENKEIISRGNGMTLNLDWDGKPIYCDKNKGDNNG